MKLFNFFILLLLTLGCTSSPTSAQEESAPSPKLITYESFSQLEPHLNMNNDSIYVVNFWATWCKPCVKELPYFEELHNTYKGKKVNVILVSLDFPDQIEKKLIPFIQDRQLKSTLFALTDGDMNSWIPKVSEEWSGAIPATLIYNNSKRAFYEQSFDSLEELNEIIKPFLILKQ